MNKAHQTHTIPRSSFPLLRSGSLIAKKLESTQGLGSDTQAQAYPI